MGEYSWGSTAGGGGGGGGAGRIAVNATLTATSSYTVPTGKLFIGEVGGLSSSGFVAVNGNNVAFLLNGQLDAFGPLCANAGDVISVIGGPSTMRLGLSGLLYDA